MPNKQKRVYNFKNLQGSSSSQPSNANQSNNGSSSSTSASVNDRLNELRKLSVSKATQKKRELADSVNQRSVPPHLRGILGVPESAPPKPKREARMRERMRTPGPAPPKSWMSASGSAASATMAAWAFGLASRRRRGRKTGIDANDGYDRDRPKTLLRFARMCGLDSGDRLEQTPCSLMHLTLKNLAINWDLFDEEEFEAFAEIPLRLRLRLLSYIDYYGPALDATALQAILQGSDPILHLDLSSLVGHRGLSLKRISRMIEGERRSSTTEDTESIAESWDADEYIDISALSLRPSPMTKRFANLTHLCLSNPAPSGAKWRELISLSKHTPRLTHLSLAYWPRPTLTPNLATTTVTSNHGPSDISAGGSHYYSALDNDLNEPMSLLRQLSSNLLCLEWLDLEGCTEWVPALGALAMIPKSPANRAYLTSSDEWSSSNQPSATTSSIFVTTWSRLAYLRISQGWLPTNLGLQAAVGQGGDDFLKSRRLRRHPIKGLMEHPPGYLENPSQDTVAFEKKRANLWIDAEDRLNTVRLKINAVRVQHKYPIVDVDHVWKYEQAIDFPFGPGAQFL